jgi:hypothetical protein
MKRDNLGFLKTNTTGFSSFPSGIDGKKRQRNGFYKDAPTSQPIAASFSNACGCGG